MGLFGPKKIVAMVESMKFIEYNIKIRHKDAAVRSLNEAVSNLKSLLNMGKIKTAEFDYYTNIFNNYNIKINEL